MLFPSFMYLSRRFFHYYYYFFFNIIKGHTNGIYQFIEMRIQWRKKTVNFQFDSVVCDRKKVKKKTKNEIKNE